MADPKGLDPFEAFKQKKKQDQKNTAETAKNEEAAKKLGWIEGIGPAGDGKPEPGKPKGFVRGRFAKPVVNPAELQKAKPKKFDDHKFAKPKPTNTEALPPEEDRRPDKFSKF
ncbi:MAG TPA: hypothetical protein VFF73_11355 [Planctomycetota bacterium]|jgi:hypothetical protein|nr:hypothetical protein [Planctomycetota bacterium]